MSDFVTLGELLIDFTPSGKSDGRNLFMQNAGGAVANAAVAMACQGLETSYIGMVGDDQFGRFLRSTLEEKGVNTDGLVLSKQYNTTLAFVHLFENGERNFSFYRKPGADIMYKSEFIDEQQIAKARVFHFGTVSMTDEPSRSATYKGAEIAEENSVIISFDPNYRAPLWRSSGDAKEHILNGLKLADIVKISDNETELVFPGLSYEKAAEEILSMGASIVYVTLGSKGCIYAVGSGSGFAQGFNATAIDATGAGDCFTGSVVAQFIKSGKTLSEYKLDDAENAAFYANAAASLCVEKKGGIPSMPSTYEIKKRLEQQ